MAPSIFCSSILHYSPLLFCSFSRFLCLLGDSPVISRLTQQWPTRDINLAPLSPRQFSNPTVPNVCSACGCGSHHQLCAFSTQNQETDFIATSEHKLDSIILHLKSMVLLFAYYNTGLLNSLHIRLLWYMNIYMSMGIWYMRWCICDDDIIEIVIYFIYHDIINELYFILSSMFSHTQVIQHFCVGFVCACQLHAYSQTDRPTAEKDGGCVCLGTRALAGDVTYERRRFSV